MTIYQPLLTEQERGNNNDNFEINITEKKLGKLFASVSKLFDNIIEIESLYQFNRFDSSKLNGRSLIIFYNLEFTLDEVVEADKIYTENNVSFIYCDCK